MSRNIHMRLDTWSALPLGQRLAEMQVIDPNEVPAEPLRPAVHPLYFANGLTPFEAACQAEET